MIAALIISNICLIFMAKGVPTWVSVVLSIVYSVSNCVALILWEETKRKIKTIENNTKRKGGE